jgi:hypothetical protein
MREEPTTAAPESSTEETTETESWLAEQARLVLLEEGV